jgi:putative transposase
MDDIFKRAPHTPPHLFRASAVYMLTASIYGQTALISAASRKIELRDAIIYAAKLYNSKLIAWVILNDHYHLLTQAGKDPRNLCKFTGSYHKFAARAWNKQDGAPRRKVWWNYWVSCMRWGQAYSNRLRYIFWNPVKHGLAQNPEDYPFSNYQDFLAEHPTLGFSESEAVRYGHEAQ